MSEAAKGLWAMVAACVVWGLSPLYYKALAHVPPLEVLSHRTLWSALFFALILIAQGRLAELRGAASLRVLAVIGFAAVMISANWFLFIFSIQSGHGVEASLGYYIFPLVAVVFGVMFFGERLGRAQVFAVGLAAVAVSVLTLGLGAAPWIALALAVTFGLYGVVKKRLALRPLVSVLVEVLLLVPLALAWLIAVHGGGLDQGKPGGWFGHSLMTSAGLAFSGVITALPLMLFSYASQKARMATVGLVQYLNPTLQFLCAVLAFGEPFTRWHLIAFALIWTALAIYSAAVLKAAARPA